MVSWLSCFCLPVSDKRADTVFSAADMGKFMKPGKVVMVLAGRYAGRKAVIVKVGLNIMAFLLFHLLLALGCDFVVYMMPDQQ